MTDMLKCPEVQKALFEVVDKGYSAIELEKLIKTTYKEVCANG